MGTGKRAKEARWAPVLLAAVATWLPEEAYDSAKAEVEGLALAVQLLQEVVTTRKLAPESMRNLIQDQKAQSIIQ